MDEMTLELAPQSSQQPARSPDQKQHSTFPLSRSVILSLAVFVLSFAVLLAGPALALRLMTGGTGASTPGEGLSPHGRFPEGSASAAVTRVTFQQGKFPTTAYTGAQDTYINRWEPTKNFANESRLLLGQSRAYRPLIRFDLTPGAIPSTARVVSAQLGIYCFARNLFNEMEAQVYRVRRPWNAQQATWLMATASSLWAMEGCDDPDTDRFPTAAITRSVFDRNTFQYFDVTSIAQSWVSNPASNRGFLLVGPDPAVIYYYYSSRTSNPDQRPKLIITWTVEPATPTPTATPTVTPTVGPSPTPTATPPGPPVVVDNTTPAGCYTHTLGVWQLGTGGGGYGGDYEYENVTSVVTASWRPCLANPLPFDSMYYVQAHWSVHSTRPQAVPYAINYDGGSATVFVNQTKNAAGGTAPDFSASGWHNLGVYPFRAGTYTTTGEYVELSSPPDASVTCADAVRWVPAPGVPGPPYTLTMTADPTQLPSDGASTSTIVVTVTDKFGNKVPDGTMVGLTTTLGSLPYTYTEAESAGVTKLGTYTTTLDANASSGALIYFDAFGDEASWGFWGQSVSMIYFINVGGGVADVSVDGTYVGTISFASASPRWRVETQLTNTLSSGLHVLRVRSGGVGRIWLDAFRSGGRTTGGVVTTTLTAPFATQSVTATVRAVAIGAGLTALSSNWPYTETAVSFPGPFDVWVDDDYCSACFNDGHIWSYDAFKTIQGGVDKVLSGGAVHVAAGTYRENVTVAKPLRLLGTGSGATILDGISDAPGSHGFYVDRADDVTIAGFRIKNFDTGVYLRGTGSAAGPRIYNANVVYNQFESNSAGSSSYAIRGSYVYTSTLCSNDITLGYNGIFLENAFLTTICYNHIYNNLGFGIKIDTGNDNSIDSNTIHDNQNLGIELTGPTLRNGIYGNVLHDLWWDAILVNGTLPSSVNVVANVITKTNQVWVDAGGNPPDANHNLGGIVLRGAQFSSVYDNRVTAVSDAEGHRANAAGIYLDGNAAPVSVETNLVQSCAGHGIYVSAAGGTPTVYGNSIYSNARFGLRSDGALMDAKGNWWGRNLPTISLFEPADLRNAPVFWDPPISVTLSAWPTSIPANGVATSTITATASGFGYNILDGTWITFSSDLSTLIYPVSTVFGAGQANTILQAGIIAGVATITGTAEPGVDSVTTTVTLTALSPYTITVTAYPTSIPVGGSQSIVTATIWDIYNNPVPNVMVTFASNALGGVAPSTRTTLAGTGAATTTFTSGAFLGRAVVTATASLTLTASTNITITAGPPCTGTITAVPRGLPANGVATSTLTVAMTDCVGYPVPNGVMVGFTTTLGSIVNYRYTEAESAEVITSTGWSIVLDTSASGDYRLETNSAGAAAYWVFWGEAVSLIYQRHPLNGMMRVRVDGGPPVDIDASTGSVAWIEQIIATNLDPAVPHQLEVTCQSGRIRLDAFRSGPITNGGRAMAILRAPVLAYTDTATVFATERIGHPTLPKLVFTTSVVFSQTNVVWVDDDWAGFANGTPVIVPGGTAYIGNDAFPTIPLGVTAVRPAGTVFVLNGNYPLPVNITQTLNLLGAGAAGTVVDGHGLATPGITITTGINNVVISGFRVANWDRGLVIVGPSSGLEISNNVFTGCTTLAISGAWVDPSRIASNEIRNGGSGIELDTVDNTTLDNNHVHDMNGFGIRIFSSVGTSTGNVLSYNQVHDLDWNGIIVGMNCQDTRVLTNTIYTTNRVNAPTYKEGGIVLYSTTNTTVDSNRVSDVRTSGGSPDTAGIWIGGTNSGGAIRYNRIIGNANDGILFMNYSSPPEVHCNHIYGNGHFGFRNMLTVPPAAPVNATGNWWGHNPPPTAGAAGQWDLYTGAGANMSWDPAISLTLTAATPTVYVGGPSITIRAVACGGSCCMLDQTPITFTTNLGGLGYFLPRDSVVTSMNGGQATTPFTPGTIAGTATITASVPNAGVVTTTVVVLPERPASISLLAVPGAISVGTGPGSQSTLYAYVQDMYGNWVIDGTLITFTTSLGSVTPTVGSTIAGVAQSTLYAGTVPGVAIASASWGYVVGSTYVEIGAGAPFSITSLIADPSSILANGVATSRITATVRDQYDNLVPDGTMVGYTTTAGSLIHAYVEAESPVVVTSTGWTSHTVGGVSYIETSLVGASARWSFRGEAVSLIYRRFGTGGVLRARVDGGAPVDINTNDGAAWIEAVIASDLDGSVWHQLEVFCQSGTIRLDAFRSGSRTLSGQAVAILTSSPLPPATAYVQATAIGGTFPTRTVAVEFLAPLEVWVDDNYCSTCPNDGHQWGFDAFSNMPAGVTAVRSAGTVHVLAGTYTLPVTIDKPLYLDGEGSGGTSAVVGSGTGNGIYVRYDADGTIIEGFAIRNFGYGVYLAGRSTNRLQDISISNLVITGCATGAITGTYVNNGYFADNALHHNFGFGFDLDTGDGNRIEHNHVYENMRFGVRVFSSAGTGTSNALSNNNVHDLYWEGIRVGPNLVNTSVLSNTVRATNLEASALGFNAGGIVLYNTVNSTVEYNTVSDVRTAGGSVDTGGIWLGGVGSLGGMIRHNIVIDNANDGIVLSNFYSPPEVHCNHIYGNGRYGLRNSLGAPVQAQGNWWGHNPPLTSPPSMPADISGAVVSDPPITVVVIPAQPTTFVGGPPIAITAMGCGGGCCLLDRMSVIFTTNLGGVGSPPAPTAYAMTSGGQARVAFTPGTVAGVATITAIVPDAGVVTTTVTILAGPPFTMTITATPPAVWVTACAPPGLPNASTVALTVTDQYGNPSAGQIVTFASGPPGIGTVSPISVVLNANGYGLAAFMPGNLVGMAWVTATAGSLSRSVPIEVMSGPPMDMVLDRWPAVIAADGVSTSTITATVRDACGTVGNLIRDGTMVGFATTRGTLPYAYVEAESASVIKSTGNWTSEMNVNASGQYYLRTDTSGAWARWPFTGSAVSLVYLRTTLGGSARVLVDGVLRKTIDMSSTTFDLWQRETVIANDLDPYVPHTVQVECITGRVYLDAFRSGTTTVNGVATAVLTSERVFATANITATAVDSRLESLSLSERPQRLTTVEFQRSNLAITKRANAPTVPSGDLINFTVVYTNTGLAQATNTLITDTLPISLTYVSTQSSPNVGEATNPITNVWVWQAGNVLPAHSGVITFTARRICQPGQGIMTNTVSIGSLTIEAPPTTDNYATAGVNAVVGAPFTVTLTSVPSSIPTDSHSTVYITVTDGCGDALPDVTVYITTNVGAFNAAGTLTTTTRVTNINGEATLTFWGGPSCGIATIIATAGAAHSAPLYVAIVSGSPARTVVTANPTVLPADGLSTSTISAQVLDAGVCPVADGLFVGFTRTLGSLLYGYVEDSSPEVHQSPAGSWIIIPNASASGGSYMSTIGDGASVYWDFYGNGVSLVYGKAQGAGIADVHLYPEDISLGEINMHSVTGTVWLAEKVFTWSGSSTASHRVVVTRRGGSGGAVFVDALRSGVTTYGGQALAVLTSPTITGTSTVAATGIWETPGGPLRLPGFVNVRFDAADLLISKAVQPQGQVSIGQKITFTLAYQNNGLITATNAYLEDALSMDALRDMFFSTQPLTVTPYLRYRWPLGAVGVLRSGVITFGGTIDTAHSWPSATVLTNTAVITSSTVEVDPRALNNTSSVTITIVPGRAVALTLTASPASIPVGGSPSTLRATARDTYGNPVANGTPITFTTTLGGFPTATQSTGFTNSGVATVTLTSGNRTGTANVAASLDSTTAFTQVVFTPLGAFTVTVTATPGEIPVGGFTSFIEALMVDRYGNWVPDGTLVTFATSAGNIAPSVVGTVNSRASTTLTSGTLATTATITATVGSARGTTTVRFIAGPPIVTMTANPATLSVDDASSIVLTAHDAFNNPLRSEVVTFTTTMGNLEGYTTTMRTTDVNGRASALLRSMNTGTAIVTGTIRTTSAFVTVTFVAGDPYTISLGVDPSIIPGCGGTATARAVVRDRYGNLVRDGTVVVFNVAPQGDVRPIDGGRTTNGVALGIVSSGNVPGPATVWAWPERWRTSVVAQYPIVFLVGPPDRLQLSAQPAALVVGGNRAAIKLRVDDCGGTPVVNSTPVTFTLVSGEGSLSPEFTTTSNGWAYATLTSPNETGSATIRASAGERQATLVVEYIPGPAWDIALDAVPAAIPADGVSSSAIGAEIKDSYGNHVPDRTTVVFTTDLGRFETGASYTTATRGGRASAILTSSTTFGRARVAATCAGGRRGEIYVDFYLVPTPTPTPTRTPRYTQGLPIIVKYHW